jgi:hypothetical protein
MHYKKMVLTLSSWTCYRLEQYVFVLDNLECILLSTIKLHTQHVWSIYIAIISEHARTSAERERERPLLRSFALARCVHVHVSSFIYHANQPLPWILLVIIPIPGNRNKLVAHVAFYKRQTTSILLPNLNTQIMQIFYYSGALVGIWFICMKHN